MMKFALDIYATNKRDNSIFNLCIKSKHWIVYTLELFILGWIKLLPEISSSKTWVFTIYMCIYNEQFVSVLLKFGIQTLERRQLAVCYTAISPSLAVKINIRSETRIIWNTNTDFSVCYNRLNLSLVPFSLKKFVRGNFEKKSCQK